MNTAWSCFVGALAFIACTADAQEILHAPDPDSPIGMRNPDAPAGTAQYEFLIGDWDVDVVLVGEGEAPLEYRARWHNHWIADGHAVMQEWRGPYATGIELRTWDEDENRWQGRNIYFPSPARWYANVAELIGDEMIVTTHREDESGSLSITREIYFDIAPDSFRIRTEQSVDNGQTWTPGRYSALSTRSAPPP